MITPSLSQRPARQGYAMLIALVLIAVLTIIGATSLSVAGVDQRIAMHNQRHMVVVNAADAGTNHARFQLESVQPLSEGWDAADPPFVFSLDSGSGVDDAETYFAGTNFPMNQGTYEVSAVYAKCSGPPPGYSTEQGHQAYRSDYWDMHSRSWFRAQTGSADDGEVQVNPIEATVVATVRKVVAGPCKIR